MIKNIGIVVAMPEEYKYYEELLASQKYIKKDIIKKEAFEFHLYVLDQEKLALGENAGTNKIIIVKSQIGKTNAAIATTLLIHMFNPDIVLNTGSVGGIDKQLKIGDLLVGRTYKYCDVDASVFGYEKGQVPQMPVDYQGDAMLLKYCEELKMTARFGTVGTTDTFITDKSKVEEYEVSCVDMEAAAVAQACYHFNIPFLAIKAISDQADGKSPDNFKEFVEQAGKNTAKFVIELIIRINK